MLEWSITERGFRIRDVEGEPEFHAIEELQREAWGFSDLDIVPAATLIATQHAGGIVLGAFEGERMVGFAYGFPAFERGRTSIHSHMLAVHPDYRNLQLGFFLKLAQRDRTLGMGLDEITWTFDPLQSLNAHLNFAKLGVISNRYIVNFYGEETSSPLHQGFGTDRLWVRWLLTDERVSRRVERVGGQAGRAALMPDTARVTLDPAGLIVSSQGGEPRLSVPDQVTSRERCFIEIPHDIGAIKERDGALGVRWREATRAAFLSATGAGFTATDFIREDDEGVTRWFYVLTKESE